MLHTQTKILKRQQFRLQTAATRGPLSTRQEAKLRNIARQLLRIRTIAPRKLRQNRRLQRVSEATLDDKRQQYTTAKAAYRPIFEKNEALTDTSGKEDKGFAKTLLSDKDLSVLLGRKKGGARFGRYGGANLSSLGRLAVLCTTRTRIRRQAPFDTYRTRLWDKLTLRRSKRERVARYWIKETGR